MFVLALIRCHYCKRLARWAQPETGIQACLRCKRLIDRARWNEVARLWLKNYPDDWTEDAAAIVRMEVSIPVGPGAGDHTG